MKLLPIILSAFFVTSLPASAKPFQHKFGELREYHRHWLAVCPSKTDTNSVSFYERTCWASTYSEKGGGQFPGRRLSVLRDRFTGEISVRLVGQSQEQYREGSPVIIKFSTGSTVSLDMGRTFATLPNSGNEFTILDQKAVQDTVRLMKEANRATFILPTHIGEERISFSMI